MKKKLWSSLFGDGECDNSAVSMFSDNKLLVFTFLYLYSMSIFIVAIHHLDTDTLTTFVYFLGSLKLYYVVALLLL